MIIYTRTTSLLVDFRFLLMCWLLQISLSVHGVLMFVFGFAALSVLSFAIPKCWFIEKGFFSGTLENWFLFCFVLLLRRGVAAMMRCDCVELWSRIVCGSSALSGSVLLVLFLVYFTIHYRLVLSCNINTSCCNNGVLSTGVVSVIDRSFIVILFA